MVPDKFNMVDMEGIDIITSQGEEIPGLYQKLVESITQCRYQCVYNWKFDGILIPPTYVEMTIIDDVVWINEGVSVDEEDVIRIYSLEPPPPEPVIQELEITENGIYSAPVGVDGFDPVTVEVPSTEPVIQSKTITENGTYEAPTGVDGFDPVIVNVPSVSPVIQSKTITSNGTYIAPSGVDGFNPVVVNVPASTSNPIAYWDLTQSVVDEIGGVSITLNNASISSAGVALISQNAYIAFPAKIINFARRFDVEVGDMNVQQISSHNRFITFDANSYNSGLIYRSTGEWSFYNGSTWDGSGITDKDYFDNSTVTVLIEIDGKWKIFKDGVLVFSPSLTPSSSSNVKLAVGSSAQSLYNAVIKSITLY